MLFWDEQSGDSNILATIHDHIEDGDGVLDTACTRTLIGEETLRTMSRVLRALGLGIKFINGRQRFRFGNGQFLTSKRIAIIPICLGTRYAIVRAFVIPGRTPLLMSLIRYYEALAFED